MLIHYSFMRKHYEKVVLYEYTCYNLVDCDYPIFIIYLKEHTLILSIFDVDLVYGTLHKIQKIKFHRKIFFFLPSKF